MLQCVLHTAMSEVGKIGQSGVLHKWLILLHLRYCVTTVAAV